MSEVKDAKGWPLKPGMRVFVRLPVQKTAHVVGCSKDRCDCPKYPITFSGEVLAVEEERVQYREFLTFAFRNARPGWCVVQRGKTRSQREHEILAGR